MQAQRFICLLFIMAVVSTVRADTLKMKDGTTLDGEITAEDESSVSIYLEFSRGTITQTRRIDKSDIAEIIRWTPEQKQQWRMERDYEKLQAYRLNANDSYLLEYYDQTIDNVFQRFLDDYPDSRYTSNVVARIADWKAERALVSAGNIKFRGRWSPAAEVGPLIARERGQKLLEQARGLIAQRRFESAIPELQVVAHMKDHGELVAQATPLLKFTYDQAIAALEHETRQLSNDVAAADTRRYEAHREIADAENALKQLTDRQPAASAPQAASTAPPPEALSHARLVLTQAQINFSAAQNQFDRANARQNLLIQRLATLKLQARELSGATVPSAAKAEPPPPKPSPDAPEVLITLMTWVRKNWPGMVIALLAILFLMSRFAKD